MDNKDLLNDNQVVYNDEIEIQQELRQEFVGEQKEEERPFTEVDDDPLFAPIGGPDLNQSIELENNEQEIIPENNQENQEKENQIAQEAANAKLEEEKFAKLSSSGKALYLIRNYGLPGNDYEKLYNAAKNVTKLYVAAGKENATAEQKKALALASFDFNKRFSAYLSNLKKNEPEKFNSNTNAANLMVAHQYNLDVCSRAIENVNGDILPELIDGEFNRLLNVCKGENGAYSTEALENSIAQTLYLSKLKYEFDHVHGTEEEQKAWRSEILNELLSDRFEKNVEEFKKTELYANVRDKFDNLPDFDMDSFGVKERIDDAISEMANRKYHSVSGNFADGAKTEYQKEAVKKAAAELDELRGIGENIGSGLDDYLEKIRENDAKNNTHFADEIKLKNYGNDPHFDTLFMKKAAKLYGVQENVAGKLLREKEEPDVLKNRTDDIERRKIERLEQDFNKEYGKIVLKEDVLQTVKYLIHFEKLIEKNKAKIAELSKISPTMTERERNEKLENERESLKLNIAQKAFYSDELFTKYEADVAGPIEKKYRAQLELEEKKKSVRAEAEQIAKENIKDFMDGVAEVPERIERWTRHYNDAVKKNDEEEIKKCTSHLDYNINLRKSQEPELYRKVWNGEEDIYISLPLTDAKNKMTEAHNRCKDTYGTTTEQDTAFENSIKKYEEIEKLYQPEPIAKPDRSEYELLKFVPAKQNTESKVDLKNVPIAQGIHSYAIHYNPETEIQNSAPLVAQEGQEPNIYLTSAIAPVFENRNAWFGTDEYKNILTGMKDLQTQIQRGEGNSKEYASECRRLIAAMNQYIDRKADERDGRSREKTVSRNRRQAMETARICLKNAVKCFDRQAGTAGEFHGMEEATYELQAVMGLAKSKHPEEKAILELMQTHQENPNVAYRNCREAMYRYLEKNVLKYRKEDKYSFRLRENGQGGKRIPENEDERLYKAVLLAFEKVENEYYRYLEKEMPQNLPATVFNMTNLMSVTGRKNPSDAYGINVWPNNMDLSITLRERGNLKDTKTEFLRVYAISAAKSEVANRRARMLYHDTYDSANAFRGEDAELMAESMFSYVFLDKLDQERMKSGNQAKEPDMDKLEQDRKQFVSVMKKSSAYEKILEKCSTYFDLNKTKPDPASLAKKGTELRSKVASPKMFITRVIPDIMVDDMVEKLNDSLEMLEKPEKYKKEAVSKNLEEIEYNIKVSKALGIWGDVEMKAFMKMQGKQLIAGDFSEIVQKVKEQAQNKQVKKMEEPVKGIKLK